MYETENRAVRQATNPVGKTNAGRKIVTEDSIDIYDEQHTSEARGVGMKWEELCRQS
jgi:hypothetical protein